VNLFVSSAAFPPLSQRSPNVLSPSQDLDEVPSEVLTLVDRKCLEAGFHIETGDKAAPREPVLEIDHKEEYVSFFKENLHGVEHSNYIGVDEETDIFCT
jgi:hypothetical protein